MSELSRLVELGEIVDLAPGDRSSREGEQADALFVDPRRRARRHEAVAGGARSRLPASGPGALQGEIAALEGGRRLASVRAVDRGRGAAHPDRRHPRAAGRRARRGAGDHPHRGRAPARRWRRRCASARSWPPSARWPPAWPTSSTIRPPLRARSARALARGDGARRGAAAPGVAAASAGSMRRPPRSALERADRIDEVAALDRRTRTRPRALVDAGWTAEAAARRCRRRSSRWLAAPRGGQAAAGRAEPGGRADQRDRRPP